MKSYHLIDSKIISMNDNRIEIQLIQTRSRFFVVRDLLGNLYYAFDSMEDAFNCFNKKGEKNVS